MGGKGPESSSTATGLRGWDHRQGCDRLRLGGKYALLNITSNIWLQKHPQNYCFLLPATISCPGSRGDSNSSPGSCSSLPEGPEPSPSSEKSPSCRHRRCLERSFIILLFTADTVVVAAPGVVIVLALVPHARGVAGTERSHGQRGARAAASLGSSSSRGSAQRPSPVPRWQPGGQRRCSASSPQPELCRTGRPGGPAGRGSPGTDPTAAPQAPEENPALNRHCSTRRFCLGSSVRV